MRPRTSEDLTILTALAGAYRLEGEMCSIIGCTGKDLAVLLTLAASAATPGAPDMLSMADIKRVVGCPDYNIPDVHKVLQKYTGDETRVLIQKHPVRPAKFSLTAAGVKVVRKALELQRQYKQELLLLGQK